MAPKTIASSPSTAISLRILVVLVLHFIILASGPAPGCGHGLAEPGKPKPSPGCKSTNIHPDWSTSLGHLGIGLGTVRMRCKSCEEEKYLSRDSSFCKECYEKVSKTVEEYKREIEDLKERHEKVSKTAEEYKQDIEDLKAKNFFLKLWIQTDHKGRSHGPGFGDIALVTAKDGPDGGQSKPVLAHRAILASRSPVFKAMFENEMEQTRYSTIKISEVSYDVVRAFVNYLYTAEACLDEQMSCDLLILAEKYQVKHLKAYCEKFLISKLNWDNSIIKYAFAHQHNAKLLLEAALSLIMDNMHNLKNRQEYLELIEKEPRLVVEIYEACLAKQENTTVRVPVKRKSVG